MKGTGKKKMEINEFIEVDLRHFLSGYSVFLRARLGGFLFENRAVEKDRLSSSVARLLQGLERSVFRTSVLRYPEFGLPPEDADLFCVMGIKALHKPLPSGIDLSVINRLVLPKDYATLSLLSNVSMPNLRSLAGRSGIDHFPRHLVEGSQVASGEIPGTAFTLNWFGMYAVPLWMKPYIEAGHLRLDVGDYMWSSTGHDCLGWRDVKAMEGFMTRDDLDRGMWFPVGYFEKGQDNPHPVLAHRPLRPFELKLARAKDIDAALPAADLKAPHKDELEEEKTGPLNILDLPPEIWEQFFRNLNNAQRLTLLAAFPDCASSFLAVGLEGVMLRPTVDLPHQPRADQDQLTFLGDALDLFSTGDKPLIQDDDFTLSVAWPARNHCDVIRYNAEEVVSTHTPFPGLSLLEQSQRMVYQTSLTIKGRFRFEPIFGQKEHQEFWEQATVPCPEKHQMVVQKTDSGFMCAPTDTKTLKQNFMTVHNFGRLNLKCVPVEGIGKTPGFDQHKKEVNAFLDALRADVKYFEIFMDYVRADREELIQSYGPCHMECAEKMPSLTILKEMYRSLAFHKIKNQRYLQNHILKMALRDELMALAQAFPSTAISPKDVGEGAHRGPCFSDLESTP